jgi:hypothetical protein
MFDEAHYTLTLILHHHEGLGIGRQLDAVTTTLNLEDFNDDIILAHVLRLRAKAIVAEKERMRIQQHANST